MGHSEMENWSPNPDENIDTPPAGAPEGMERPDVNNVAREMMASTRQQWEGPAWFDRTQGPINQGYDITRVSNEAFSVAHQSTPTDASAKFPIGSRMRIGDSVPNYVYGYVDTVIFATPDTIVTLTMDTGEIMPTPIASASSHLLDASAGSAAYSALGTTTAQTPPEVPSIDDLGDGALLDMGAGNGFDADTVDGQHASDLIGASSGARDLALLNGNFAVAQRGNPVIAGGTFPNDNGLYTLDQWVLLVGHLQTHPIAGSGPVDVSTINSGASDGDADGVAGRLTGNAAVGVDPWKVGLIQWLTSADCRNLAGGTVSLSYWARSSGGFSKSQVAVVAWGGAADGMALDPVDDWGAVGTLPTMLTNYTLLSLPTSNNLTTGWIRHTVEDLTLPSGTTNIGVMIWGDDESWTNGDTLDWTAVTLVSGSLASRFKPIDYWDNQRRCARFCQTTFDQGITPADFTGELDSALFWQTGNGGQGGITWNFGGEMFKLPTITTFNPASAPQGGVLAAAIFNRDDGRDVEVPDNIYIGKRRVQIEDNDPGETNKACVLHAIAIAVL